MTDHAREAVSYLIWHPDLPLPARLPYGVLVAAAIGLMPPWSRKPLGLPMLPVVHDRVAAAARRPRDPHHPLGDDQRPVRRRPARGRPRPRSAPGAAGAWPAR